MANEITGTNPALQPKSVNSAQQQTPSLQLVGGNSSVPETQDAQAVNAQNQSGQEPTFEEIKDAAKQVSDVVQNIQRSLNFSVDEGSGKTVVKVIDTISNELIRQIPSEEILALAAHLQASGESDSAGMLFKADV